MNILIYGRKKPVYPYKLTTAERLAIENNWTFTFCYQKVWELRDTDTLLIRYGKWTYPHYDNYFGDVINRGYSIWRNSNKLVSVPLLAEHKIRVPKHYFYKEAITKDDLPVLGRRYNHSRGKDIQYIETLEQLENDNSEYWVKYIPSIEEYRITIFKDECIRIAKKVPRTEEYDEKIRSFSRGWKFIDIRKRDFNTEEKLCRLEQAVKMCIKAMKILELDFGAVDVLISVDNKPVILEVNSAPHLNKFGRQLFAYYVYKYIEEEKPLEEFSRLRKRMIRLSILIPEFRDIIKRDE